MSNPQNFAVADREMLEEIIRQAESYLQAQLTAGIAADQRAMSFFGTTAAAAALIITGGVTLILQGNVHTPLGWAAIATAFGLLISIALASLTAKPVSFCYPGNSPGEWVADILSAKGYNYALAETAAHYDDFIHENKITLDRNATMMAVAIWTAWLSLLFGSVFAATTMLKRL